jgi:hypothetical protein
MKRLRKLIKDPNYWRHCGTDGGSESQGHHNGDGSPVRRAQPSIPHTPSQIGHKQEGSSSLALLPNAGMGRRRPTPTREAVFRVVRTSRYAKPGLSFGSELTKEVLQRPRPYECDRQLKFEAFPLP